MAAEKARRGRACARARRSSLHAGDAASHARRARAPGAGVARRGAAEARDRGRRRAPRRRSPRSKDKKHREAACKAAIVRAQAVAARQVGRRGRRVGRRHRAMRRARTRRSRRSTTAARPARRPTATPRRSTRFDLVEKRFPAHRLADDARFHAALVVYDEGDEAKYLAMLASRARRVPRRRHEGRGALPRRARPARRSATSTARARRSTACSPCSPTIARWGSAGRAAYFRARVAQLAGDARRREGALRGARRRSAARLLHAARVRAPARARRRRRARGGRRRPSRARRPGPFLTARAPGARDARRSSASQRLLEVGEIDAARREATAGGLVAESVDPEVLWTVAWLYDRAGAPELGHSFARVAARRLSRPLARRALAARPGRSPSRVRGTTSSARESASAGIPPPLTWAIMREESAFNPDAQSGANAIGLMQLLVGHGAAGRARARPLVVDEPSLHRPEVSIALGARLLASAARVVPRRTRRSPSPRTTAARAPCGAGWASAGATTSTSSSSASPSTRRATTSSACSRARPRTRTSTRPRRSTSSSRCPQRASGRR